MIDAHCHVDLYRDPHRVIREAEQQDVIIIAVTNLPTHFEAGYPHVRGLQRVRLALGLHPLLAERHSVAEFRSFERLLAKTSYVGEVGLDYSREGESTAKKQLASFRFVLDAIKDSPRFVTLHTRGAESVVLKLLEEYAVPSTVFHWYSGPTALVDEIVAAGHYFSVNPAMVRSKKGRQIIELIPRDRMLTETDGPHLRMGKRPVKPFDVTYVLEYLARIWNTPLQETERQIQSSFNRIVEPIRQFSKSPAKMSKRCS